ncbi:terminase small subunit [Aurantivibrio infirmus]
MPIYYWLIYEEYIQDLNATESAIRAGYSEMTAGSQDESLQNK